MDTSRALKTLEQLADMRLPHWLTGLISHHTMPVSVASAKPHSASIERRRGNDQPLECGAVRTLRSQPLGINRTKTSIDRCVLLPGLFSDS